MLFRIPVQLHTSDSLVPTCSWMRKGAVTAPRTSCLNAIDDGEKMRTCSAILQHNEGYLTTKDSALAGVFIGEKITMDSTFWGDQRKWVHISRCGDAAASVMILLKSTRCALVLFSHNGFNFNHPERSIEFKLV